MRIPFVPVSGLALFVTLVCLAPADDVRAAGLLQPDEITLRDAQAEPAPSPSRADAASPDPFDKGSWAIYVQGMHHMDVERQDTTVGAGTVGFGYYVSDNRSWNFQLSFYDLQQDDEADRFGGSFDIVYRIHFINRDPWTVFIDGGAGVLWADGHFPAGGTHQNFMLQAGFGATYRLGDDLHLLGAAKWFHISNARKRGRERNPHTDGIGVFVGLLWMR